MVLALMAPAVLLFVVGCVMTWRESSRRITRDNGNGHDPAPAA
jgi:hypothetical protein